MDAKCITANASTVLRRGDLLNVQGPAGTIVEVTHGEVWVTRHQDLQDHILGSGQVLEHTGQGKTLVSAVKDALVKIQFPSAAPKHRFQSRARSPA